MTDIPPAMRAIDPEISGDAEILTLVERPTPAPGPEEVLIRVAAAGVNRADVLQRRGFYPPPPGITSIPGLEAAGTVVATGVNVTWPVIGERVTAIVAGGAYAEYLVAPAAQCLPVPDGLSLAEAAVLPETWFTVRANLHDLANMQSGDWLLVHGGTSGIGMTAIDYARLHDMPIIVTCGTDAKAEAARKAGADYAINYKEQDFVAIVSEVTKGRGVDGVLDMVGGSYVGRNLACLASGGRHVSIAFQGGRRAEIDLALVMQKQLLLTGSTLRSRAVAEKGHLRDALLKHVWPGFADGRLGSRLYRSFAASEAADAHRLMESGGHIGKIALLFDSKGSD